jgi:hypothetical protein
LRETDAGLQQRFHSKLNVISRSGLILITAMSCFGQSATAI